MRECSPRGKEVRGKRELCKYMVSAGVKLQFLPEGALEHDFCTTELFLLFVAPPPISLSLVAAAQRGWCINSLSGLLLLAKINCPENGQLSAISKPCSQQPCSQQLRRKVDLSEAPIVSTTTGHIGDVFL